LLLIVREPASADSKFCRSSELFPALGATTAGVATIFSTAAARWPGDRCTYRCTLLSVRQPPGSWTVRKSTPAATRREANVCLNAGCLVLPARRPERRLPRLHGSHGRRHLRLDSGVDRRAGACHKPSDHLLPDAIVAGEAARRSRPHMELPDRREPSLVIPISRRHLGRGLGRQS
jgi:hypothetical protein